MIRAHASGLGRLVRCPGSFEPAKFTPNTGGVRQTNRATEEGIAAHHLADALWHGQDPGDTAPNGVVYDPAMRAHVAEYIAKLGELAQDDAWFERKETYQINGIVEVVNKLDFATFCDEQRIVDVVDFKYGYRIVQPYDNWQLLSYGFQFIKSHQRAHDAFRKLRLTIYQPRGAHSGGAWRSVELSSDEVAARYSELSEAIKLLGADDTRRTGEHCAYCPKLPTCGAARSAGQNAVDVSLNTDEIEELESSLLELEILNLRRAKTHVEERLNAMEELARARLARGEKFRRFRLDRSKPRTIWKDDVDFDLLELLTGVTMYSKKPGHSSTSRKARRTVYACGAKYNANKRASGTSRGRRRRRSNEDFWT